MFNIKWANLKGKPKPIAVITSNVYIFKYNKELNQ